MDVLRISTDWARAEVFSAKMVWVTSLLIIVVAAGFAYFGKTAMARAYIWPNLVAGLFLTVVGLGLYLANKPRISRFESEYKANPETFIKTEITRVQKSKNELAIVLKVLPSIILLAALLVILVSDPTWRGVGITFVVLAVILLIVDSNTDARNSEYLQQLRKYEQSR